MRLARTASPLPRSEQIWPAGVEPAISGAQDRRGGRLPHSQWKTQRLSGGFAAASPTPASAAFATTTNQCERTRAPEQESGSDAARRSRAAPAKRCEEKTAAPPAGFEPAASGLRARRHRHFDHRGMRCNLSRRSLSRTRLCSVSASRAAADTYLRRAPAAGIEPAPRD